uniref:LCP family glycopolymer transferase n=1 Tax=Candidatus Ventrimonas sp. TaxID=3048889 RepID=UPI003FEF10F4
MRYDENSYEDELDRMRIRNQKRAGSRNSAGSKETPQPNSQGWDDTIVFLPNSSRDRTQNSRRAASESDIKYSENASRTGQKRRTAQTSQAHSEPDRRRTSSRHSGGHARKKKKKTGFLTILCLAAVIIAGTWVFHSFRDDGYWTIAVFGVDSRDGNTGKGALSDVEMLCSIHKKTGEIRLLSVFRDTYLRIDQKEDFDKINEAYFLGGPEQAINALEDNLDLQIDDYATFNWKAVVDAINVLGGVDIDITDKEFAYINSFITETVNSTGVGSYQLEHSGMNHLDGVQAVAYARLRLMDTDFNRTERQRKVLGQAMEKAKNSDLKTLTTLIGTVYPQIKTSVGVDNLAGMAKNAKKYYISQTSGFPFSHQEIKIGKKACVVPTTLESNVVQLHSFLYNTENYVPSENLKSISSHIIEVSGFGDPGKDTESGKNVGAEGNNGGGQAGSSQTDNGGNAKPPAQETQPAETEQESSVEENTEESTSETEETIQPLESVDNTEGTGSESESEDSDRNQNSEETRDPDRVIEAPSETVENTKENGPGIQNSENNSHRETNASLEAPGQSREETPEQGPGV